MRSTLNPSQSILITPTARAGRSSRPTRAFFLPGGRRPADPPVGRAPQRPDRSRRPLRRRRRPADLDRRQRLDRQARQRLHA
ncbi:hypothetical protein TsocGM_12755 [Tautonia sociabilis]|uniref:Uncharacterized protein n=1 Tax=Tautonia sociabilis TaxID=2080755 RepID=A0A432MJ42_9BACT|nr:hypothetical protein TsocGM_12755 [Tautonia sociabilis]